MTTVEERVARLEGGYEHLATKADLASAESRLSERISGLEIKIAELGAQMLLIAQAVIVPSERNAMGFGRGQQATGFPAPLPQILQNSSGNHNECRARIYQSVKLLKASPGGIS